MRKRFLNLLIACLAPIAGCDKPDDGITQPDVEFTWESGLEGWEMGYADYPAGLSLDDSLNLYGMTYGHSVLPASIQPQQKGIRLAGHNRSDDLFMYAFGRVNGLVPGATYDILFDLEIASDAPTHAVGIGGAPGESVYIKAGATSTRPSVEVIDGWYRMTIDKGNQSQGGKDMAVVGHAGVAHGTTQYTLIRRENAVPLQATADDQGRLWVIVGSDSGFEGYTELYYANLRMTLTKR